MKIHFRLTDGRLWYKQIVSGVFIFLAIAIISPFAFLAVAIPYFTVTIFGLWGFAWYLAKLVATILIAFAGVMLAMMTYD